MRKLIWKLAKILGKKKMVGFLKLLNNFLRKLSLKGHSLQMDIEWGLPPQPEWFDHYLDMYFKWKVSQDPLWLERGIFNLLAIKDRSNMLELCCGDGFNAYYFYSIRANKIISVDFDKDVINHAKRFNQADNVEFKICDIRNNMPEGNFDNIIWDAAIEHFTEQEIGIIMEEIKERLRGGGILSGYTIIERSNGQKSLSHHEHEFKSKEDLMRFFTPHFNNVKVFETIYPSRHNLYFYASDGMLPFDDKWKHVTMVVKNSETAPT